MTDYFEAIVVGSGFGGTILALSLANKYEADNDRDETDKKVCLLERGQWWLSHEMNFVPRAGRKTPPNLREYLEDNGRPYHFWPHPDNVTGILELLSTAKTVSRAGLFDYKVLGNVHSIQASGVGGGSLVYSNVTLAPDSSVFASWPTQSEGKKLEEYFDSVNQFLVVNRITANAGLSNNMLEKTKAFQDAGQALIDGGNTDIINVKNEEGRLTGDFDLNLSITNVPAGLLDGPTPPEDELERLLKRQENVCQRQGRCVLGCVPNARHTFSRQLFDAINPRPPKKAKPMDIRELCEVYDIEFQEGEEYRYKVKYFQYDASTEKRTEKSLYARSVVIAAGSLGSTELLLKCSARGSLKLSKALGTKFFTNGDIFGFMTLEHRTIDVTRGPINTSYVSFKPQGSASAFAIEDTTLPKMVAPLVATLMELVAHGAREANLSQLDDLVRDLNMLFKFGVLGILAGGMSTTSLVRLFTRIWNNPSARKVLVDILKTGTSKDESTRGFMEALLTWVSTDRTDPFASPEERIWKFYAFSGMGGGEKPGVLKLRPNWRKLEAEDDPGERIYVSWPAAENNQVLKNIADGMRQLAGEMDAGGRERVYTPFWNFKDPKNSTSVILHPLGGCHMGLNVDEGVVDSYGQVFWRGGTTDKTKRYPGLYIVDGSVMPEAPGVNPTMLIAAFAYRAAERIVGPEHLPKAE